MFIAGRQPLGIKAPAGRHVIICLNRRLNGLRITRIKEKTNPLNPTSQGELGNGANHLSESQIKRIRGHIV